MSARCVSVFGAKMRRKTWRKQGRLIEVSFGKISVSANSVNYGKFGKWNSLGRIMCVSRVIRLRDQFKVFSVRLLNYFFSCLLSMRLWIDCLVTVRVQHESIYQIMVITVSRFIPGSCIILLVLRFVANIFSSYGRQ